MLKFDFRNLMSDRVGGEHGLTSGDIKSLSALVLGAHNKFQQWRSSKDALFYDVVFDNKIVEGISEKADEVAERFENIVVLGIGGSALGLKCAAGALLPPFSNLKDNIGRGRKPKLFVCDNIDPESFAGLLDFVNLEETCFVVISKSGKTTETAAQFFIVLARLQKELKGSWREHLVIITDPESGELRPFAKKEKIATFAIPPKLGGRFSVLSPVGLFPAACVGMDIEGLLAGAQTMHKRSAGQNLEDNPAYQIGGYHYWMTAKKQKPISVMMPYSDALALTADWYSQLWAESLGKKGLGQTPVKALGATDQHSQVQLYMEGPNDKVFTFVGADQFRVPASATKITETMGSFDYLLGHNLGGILDAEQSATTTALAKASRPSMTVSFPIIDAHHLGEFFMAYEIATAFAGALFGINPFDQPGVELGKVLTREILSR